MQKPELSLAVGICDRTFRVFGRWVGIRGCEFKFAPVLGLETLA